MSGTTTAANDMSMDCVRPLPAISLSDLDQVAALQRRVDRKYILSSSDLAAMVGDLSSRLAALDIDGRRAFAYESVYFDTLDLESYRSSALRRRKRFKVRTRSYVDDRTTMLEVKTRGARQITVKDRRPHSFDQRTVLGPECFDFVETVTGRAGLASHLLPVLTTEYRRTTLVDLDDITRLTIDADLRCTDVKLDAVHLGSAYIVETKSAGAPSTADRWLWAHGIRPTKISKFGTGLAVLNPELPSNKWHRTINRHFTDLQ